MPLLLRVCEHKPVDPEHNCRWCCVKSFHPGAPGAVSHHTYPYSHSRTEHIPDTRSDDELAQSQEPIQGLVYWDGGSKYYSVPATLLFVGEESGSWVNGALIHYGEYLHQCPAQPIVRLVRNGVASVQAGGR